ncbi:hypothetical protein [Marinospirillum alkaliphilum]|uniref:Uncharacterized protein n=1 Tax=Marinospirillum alkaliphilum DSM 21637 TaxID=1122209 RepID=A0A1K1WJ67_9GAMM|nr:hypothetical protein [Marinospirillum alkaliphilum]SFX37303.1 hypothetical protein SAMN02745752_01400 [Marinospirillum alkaliphilum DSM 21637]
MKQQGLPDYYRKKISQHEALERQLREELLKLDASRPGHDPDAALRADMEALLARYDFSPAQMADILLT